MPTSTSSGRTLMWSPSKCEPGGLGSAWAISTSGGGHGGPAGGWLSPQSKQAGVGCQPCRKAQIWGNALCFVPLSLMRSPRWAGSPITCHLALLLRAEKRALGRLQPFSTQLSYMASVGYTTELCPKRQSFVRLDEERCLSFLLFCQ